MMPVYCLGFHRTLNSLVRKVAILPSLPEHQSCSNKLLSTDR